MGKVAAPYILISGFFGFFFEEHSIFNFRHLFVISVFFSKMNSQECLNNFEILGAI